MINIGAPAGGEDTSITSMRLSIVDETVVLGMDWARTDRLPSLRGFRPGVLGGARRKVAQEWHRDWEEKLVKHGKVTHSLIIMSGNAGLMMGVVLLA